MKGTLDRISTSTDALRHSLPFFPTHPYSLFSSRLWAKFGNDAMQSRHEIFLIFILTGGGEDCEGHTRSYLHVHRHTLTHSLFLYALLLSLFFLSPLGKLMKARTRTDLPHTLFCSRRRRL